jgi:hypothetical protein
LILTSCASKQIEPEPEPTVIIQTVSLDCGTPPQRDPIDLRSIEWKIIGDNFTLTPDGYEDLSFNITEIWRGVEQLKAEIQFYVGCTKTD